MSHNFSQEIEGGTLWRDKILGKKISQCRKSERGTLSGFSTSILSQNIKKMKGEKICFSEKNLTGPKKLKRGILRDFPTSILAQNSKKLKGEHFGEKNFSEKKSRSAKKIETGTLWSRPVKYVTRKNRKNFFGSFR